MFKALFKSNKHKKSLALFLKSNEILLFCLTANKQHIQDQIKVASFEGWAAGIQNLVSKHKLKSSPVQLILSHSFYQKYSIDKPQVPEKEIKDAIPWALKDIINEPSHEIVCDYYSSPTLSKASEKINVITCKRSLINTLVQACKNALINLQGISIEEIALCNLFSKDDEDCILLSIEAGSELNLLAISKGHLLFQRRLRGFNELSHIAETELEQLTIDNLSLELQRSLDYLVAQLKQTQIKQIIIASPSPALETICSALNQAMELRVSAFQHPDYITNSSLTALGGALEISGANG